MRSRSLTTCDGNTAVASVAHRTNEVIAIYPITPSSTMGELADEWSAKGRKNVWGGVPDVVEMQSEGGAAGCVHGALQAGALTTTFTASQGLLLMIPNMYKIAGELTPFVMHVSARTLATHALSIFGDHSDVMACRQTGFAMLASSNVQESHDMAIVAQRASLASRIPFLHFFDGFRTSHEVAKIEELADADLLEMLPDELVASHRARALTPDHPVLRGTAQNPDTFFQAREACNLAYAAAPDAVKEALARFAALTGRSYSLFEYEGHPEAERVVVIMGSGAETARETVRFLAGNGEKVGVVTVRLYRPFPIADFVSALPPTTKTIGVLDRTKEPGSPGEPLYQDVVTALHESANLIQWCGEKLPHVVAGRYGLSSKEFTPAMVKAVFDELGKERPRPHFTVGIVDDVTHLSLDVPEELDIEPASRVRAVFYGLGSDGTVSANKNSIAIIGDGTDLHGQGYFVYDSKKSGAVTVSHLRFGPDPIRAPWLVTKAGFVACHQFSLLEKYDVLEHAAENAVFLLNAPYGPEEVWDELPFEVQETIAAKKLRFHVIDAYRLAREVGLGGRINTIMQTCFFALSGVLPKEDAIKRIKDAIRKSYGKRGEAQLQKNFAAVDLALAHLHAVVPGESVTGEHRPPTVSPEAPDFVQRVTSVMLAGKGDLLPVSAFPIDGTWPVGTAKWEKRNIALEVPVWDENLCIQCNKCAMVCPHAAIRAKLWQPNGHEAPATFKSANYRATDFKGWKYTIQVATEDCTGCTLCRVVCPAKDKANPRHKALDMEPAIRVRDAERKNLEHFLDLPEVDRTALKLNDVKSTQFLEPLFEFSGACAGCGETPYVKLVTQLFGDRALVANATGCSSIYGGNLPTTPYTTNKEGRGPAWANSLFEDNAEFGLGFRLAVDAQNSEAKRLLARLASFVGEELAAAIASADQTGEAGIAEQRVRVEELKKRLLAVDLGEARRLSLLADALVKKSVWIFGGDGWAYDIGYGGLDHVLSLGRNVNVLVLDTEVYSNTGGQQSKATPKGAAAKFATAGKANAKKDLGLMAMAYGNVYVARVAFGAGNKDAQTVKALQEAESYDGPSLVIAYSPCIAHGYDMAMSLEQQALAVSSGYWPLYRFDPRKTATGESPLVMDSGAPKGDVGTFMKNEARFRVVEQRDPARFKDLADSATKDAAEKMALYERLARRAVEGGTVSALPIAAPQAAGGK